MIARLLIKARSFGCIAASRISYATIMIMIGSYNSQSIPINESSCIMEYPWVKGLCVLNATISRIDFPSNFVTILLYEG